MSKEANATVQWLKQNNKISFVEWCPTGFKIGLNAVPAAQVEGDLMAPANQNVTMIGNNVAVSRVFTERINKKYLTVFLGTSLVMTPPTVSIPRVRGLTSRRTISPVSCSPERTPAWTAAP